MNKRISEREIKNLIAELPRPQRSFAWKGAKWDIFLAKKFFSKKWENSALHSITLSCRRSFYRYGKVSLEDDFDKKAMVLLARVSYRLKGMEVKEWLSIRFIPADGKPSLSEDLVVRFSSGLTFYDIIKEKIFVNSNQACKNLLTISRICGIPPYDSTSFIPLNKRLKYTTITSALIFFTMIELLRCEKKYQYITGLFHRDIFHHISGGKKNDKKIRLKIDGAHETLNLPNHYFSNAIAGEVAYHYPTYFFNLEQLIAWLDRMISTKKIDEQFINQFLSKPINWREIKKDLTISRVDVLERLRGLGGIFYFRGKIAGTKYTASQLRKKLEQEVDKSFVLKLITKNNLEKNIKKLLKNLNFGNDYE